MFQAMSMVGKTIVCSIKLTTELRVNAKYKVPAGE
jgi:hypothetical protein